MLRKLDNPPPALTEWLRTTHSVVLDDILMPSPLRRALLVALCRAWQSVGTHVVVSFETGRDLGGREAGLFFGYDDVDAVAYPLKPFAAAFQSCFHPVDPATTPDLGALAVVAIWGVVGAIAALRTFRFDPTPGSASARRRRGRQRST